MSIDKNKFYCNLSAHAKSLFHIETTKSTVDECEKLYGPFLLIYVAACNRVTALLNDRQTFICIELCNYRILWTCQLPHNVASTRYDYQRYCLDGNYIDHFGFTIHIGTGKLVTGDFSLSSYDFVSPIIKKRVEEDETRKTFEIQQWCKKTKQFVTTNYLQDKTKDWRWQSALFFSSNGKYMLSNYFDDFVCYDLSRKRSLNSTNYKKTTIFSHGSIIFSPTQDHIVLVTDVSEAKNIRIYNLETDRYIFGDFYHNEKRFSVDGDCILYNQLVGLEQNIIWNIYSLKKQKIIYKEQIALCKHIDICGRILFINSGKDYTLFDVYSKQQILKTNYYSCQFMPVKSPYHYAVTINSHDNQKVTMIKFFEYGIVLYNAIYALVQRDSVPLYHIVDIIYQLPEFQSVPQYLLVDRIESLQKSCRKIFERRAAFKP